MDFNEIMKESDMIMPHDILGLLVAAGLIIGCIFVRGEMQLIFLILALIIIIGVNVDLAAHGWNH